MPGSATICHLRPPTRTCLQSTPTPDRSTSGRRSTTSVARGTIWQWWRVTALQGTSLKTMDLQAAMSLQRTRYMYMLYLTGKCQNCLLVLFTHLFDKSMLTLFATNVSQNVTNGVQMQIQIQMRICRARLTNCPGTLTKCQNAMWNKKIGLLFYKLFKNKFHKLFYSTVLKMVALPAIAMFSWVRLPSTVMWCWMRTFAKTETAEFR